MRIEFQRALAYGESLETVNDTLRKEADAKHRRIQKRILDDYQSALLIRAGLNEPAGTQIHKLAKAYYDTYRKNTVPKEGNNGEEKTLAELLAMEAEEIEQELQIKDVLAETDTGKEGSEDEN